ncbi:MAG: glycosyltransferase family 2 protein [Breznakibacter sp.]
MPQISIVIVNYNVKHFLELCLHSVREASRQFEVEVLVVDNNSHDGSCDMLRKFFPEVKLVANADNLGFGKANNQAIRMAEGQFVLLLNPDTIITERTLADCSEFMRLHPDAGALGVHMVSGDGNYLRESKRALPTPKVAFFKMSGMANLFPRSKIFAKYHLGYLSKDSTHAVEILSGAFMFIRKKVLDEIGLFDEQFFMYGEDIDLSYRIILGGYGNYYLGGTRIIHFKGESTKKGSLNYVVVFYKAMEIFARKHFTGKRVSPMRLLIEMAIWLRAFLSASKLLKPLSVSKRDQYFTRVMPCTVYVVSDDEGFGRFVHCQPDINSEYVQIKPGHFYADAILAGKRKRSSRFLVLNMKDVPLSAVVDIVRSFENTDVRIKFITPHSNMLVWGGIGQK